MEEPQGADLQKKKPLNFGIRERTMTNREMFNKVIMEQCEEVVAMSDEELLNRIFKYGAWPAHELYECARVMGFGRDFEKPELLEWLQQEVLKNGRKVKDMPVLR